MFWWVCVKSALHIKWVKFGVDLQMNSMVIWSCRTRPTPEFFFVKIRWKSIKYNGIFLQTLEIISAQIGDAILDKIFLILTNLCNNLIF